MALKLEVGGIITISLNQMKSTSLYIIRAVLRGCYTNSYGPFVSNITGKADAYYN